MRQAPAFEDHGGRPAAGRALTGGWQRCGLGGGGGEREGEKGRQLPLSPPPPPTQVRLSVRGWRAGPDSSMTWAQSLCGTRNVEGRSWSSRVRLRLGNPLQSFALSNLDELANFENFPKISFS